MKKVFNSLQTKLMISFIVLIIVIAGGIFFYTYDQTKTALLEITRDDMLQIIGLASTQITPQEVDQIDQLKAGQETSPQYLAIKKKLRDMRALSPNVVNFYIMRIDGEKIVFYVDDTEDEDGARIGQVYEEPDPKAFAAVNEPAVSDNPYSDEWGTYLSGYAPIRGSTVKSGYILGADMDASTVIQRQDFIGNTIYLIMGLAVLIAALIIGLFSLTIIRDIKKLNSAAQKISTGDTDVKIAVKRSDEIGELAESFSRMVASLKIMMASDELNAEDTSLDGRK